MASLDQGSYWLLLVTTKVQSLEALTNKYKRLKPRNELDPQCTQITTLDWVCWKIGNGLSVNVWGDRWTERPLVRDMDPSGVRCVDDLFDAESGGWDMKIINCVFDH